MHRKQNTQPELLKKYRLRPSKKLGQNFLVDKRVLQKIIAASDLSEIDFILEVGSGLGALTTVLAPRVKKIIAVEKDKEFVKILRTILVDKNIKNVEIVQGDILKLDFETLKFRISSFKVVANIPYYLTSPLIRKFLELKAPPGLIVLMVQKEVARRICAKPPQMNLLSVAVQFYAEPKIISYVSKRSFWPSPEVDSAIIKIAPRQAGRYGKSKDEIKTLPCKNFVSDGSAAEIRATDFFKVVRAGFAHPRKQLANNLSTELKTDRKKIEKILEKIQLKPSQRAEELTVDNWRKLTVLIVENIV